MLGFACRSVDSQGKRKVDIFCLVFRPVVSASSSKEYIYSVTWAKPGKRVADFYFSFSPEGFR